MVMIERLENSALVMRSCMNLLFLSFCSSEGKVQDIFGRIMRRLNLCNRVYFKNASACNIQLLLTNHVLIGNAVDHPSNHQ